MRTWTVCVFFFALTLSIIFFAQKAFPRVDGNHWEDARAKTEYDTWKKKRLEELPPRIIEFEGHWIVVLPKAESFLDEQNEQLGFALAAKLTETYRKLGFQAITFETCVWNWLKRPVWKRGDMLYSCLPWNLWDGRYVVATPEVIDFMVDAVEHLER